MLSVSSSNKIWLSRLGALAWIIGTTQFFVIQIIAGIAWNTPYSWSANNISDLGSVHCGIQDADHPRYICSPLHLLVNTSFVTEGILLLLGTILVTRLWSKNLPSRMARSLLCVTALGWLIVGLYPSDINLNAHVLGAFIIFFVGNAALVSTRWATQTDIVGRQQWLGTMLGSIGLIGAVLFVGQNYLGLGMGGMERAAVFGIQIWTLVVGWKLIYFSRSPSPTTL